MAKTKDDEEPKAPIHPHGDEALAELDREQEASRKRNRQLEAEDNARRRAG